MFEKGDKVTFIDDSINGTVMSILGDIIKIETEDGFDMDCSPNEIIKRGVFDEDMGSYIDNRTMDRIMKENSMDKRRESVKRPSRKDDYLIEVDLHIERILKSHKHMDSGDILDYQVHRAKYKLEESMRSGQKGLVFIHGHGDGILKEELNTLFRRYNVRFYEADFAKYAGGATEVVFK